MLRGTTKAIGFHLLDQVFAGDFHLQRRAEGEFFLVKIDHHDHTVPYAVGNILLTAWGPVLVALMR
jgi:hypothetical protein